MLKKLLFSSRQSLFKRINCFKQQNSEENPLLLLNNSNLNGSQATNLPNSRSNFFNANNALTYNEQQLNQNSENSTDTYSNQINPSILMPYLNRNNNNSYMPFLQIVSVTFYFLSFD